MPIIISTPFRGLSYKAEVLIDNPVAYWRLGESSGASTAVDETGNYNGTYVNTPSLEHAGLIDDPNTAATFTPANLERVAISDTAGLDITGALTMEAWIQRAGGAPGFNNSGIFSKYIGSGNNRSYDLYMEQTTGAIGGTISVDGSTQTNVTSSSDYSLGIHHCVLVFIPSTSVTLYIDGSQDGQNLISIPASIYSSTADVLIGAHFDTSQISLHWDGTIDEVALYNTALSLERIQAHYNAGT